ncbi:serine/threonine protein kinase [Nocardioides sp. zg-536]|uniref:non-specific serine/threonine protein kinase n=2 Tax=Nocardioides faecalis TaxID=2803858 RepID=A0A938Y837_9ACTN|nr:serine/threonine protein kinase [Nocardioides faecalis]MBS4753228.1 serine/threonine protein kinase [Nocardioides faecalis]QVI60379.1 serine/threonine protein kinase [Nocardioides faecalis]
MIATGGMGVVWRATDTRLDRKVAVKVLKAEYADDPTFRTRFETEARSAAALHHPGIAGVYDYGAPEGDGPTQPPFLVMELVEGQPLSALLATARDAGRTLDTGVVADLLAQAADALGVAHAAGIVHRDVKPANLLVTPDRKVKITDFGIARAADAVALTRTGSVMGTPQYLSPEQARGNPSTPASDVYSLGVVAYECLTGRRPFEAETPVATALAHLQQPVPPLPDTVPPALAAVVTRALAKDPAERFADGTAFAAALRSPETVAGVAAVAGADESATQVLDPVTQQVGAAPMQRLDAPTPYAGDPATGELAQEEDEEHKRKPWLAVVAAIVAVVVIVAVLALVLGGGGDDDPKVDDTPTRTTSEPTTEPTTEEPTSEAPSETTTAPATVRVDDGRYRCRTDYRDAVADLQDEGLRVSWEQVGEPNDGRCPADSVARFAPNGTLEEGDSVTVFYWGPEQAPTTATATPTTEPTEESSEPTDPSTEEGDE